MVSPEQQYISWINLPIYIYYFFHEILKLPVLAGIVDYCSKIPQMLKSLNSQNVE